MAYAIQWWLFTAMIPVGVWVLARREAKDRAKQAAEAEVPLDAVPA